eukprot:m.308021 g.308021  ORF g.308021 m.308021 type:complete len:148 (+) comp43261_c0_seq1:49-492(+)
MESLRNLFHVLLPNYFKSIPIPKDVSGFAELSSSEILRLVAFLVLFTCIVVSLFRCLFGRGNGTSEKPKTAEEKPKRWINEEIDKNSPKVATKTDIEDLRETTVFCRCWKSKKFPMCDGSHKKHNETTGDNVGPLVIIRKEKEDKDQ